MGTTIESTLAGRRVESLRGGVRLTVVLSGGLVLTVGNDFRLRQVDKVEHFYPGLGMVPSRRLAGLAGARVAAVRVSPAGTLELEFTGERVLSVPPDTSGPTAAWQVSGPSGPLFTALPGGYLTGSQF